MSNKKELFIDCPIPMRALINALDDKSLHSLHSIVWEEMHQRNIRMVEMTLKNPGFYPFIMRKVRNDAG